MPLVGFCCPLLPNPDWNASTLVGFLPLGFLPLPSGLECKYFGWLFAGYPDWNASTSNSSPRHTNVSPSSSDGTPHFDEREITSTPDSVQP